MLNFFSSYLLKLYYYFSTFALLKKVLTKNMTEKQK